MSDSDSSWSMSIASSRACRCSPRSSAGTSRFLSEHTGDARPDTLVYLRVRDAEQLAATLGVPTEDNPWGRDFEIADPDGNRLRIGTPSWW